MTLHRVLIAFFISGLLSGCSAEDYSGVTLSEADTASAYVPEDWSDLRVDIQPGTTQSGGAQLLSQSAVEISPDSFLDIALKPTVSLSGSVQGWTTTPWAIGGLPGTEGPISGNISIHRYGTIQSYNATTDEFGQYSLNLVEDGDYVLHFVPDDPINAFYSQPIDAPPILSPLELSLDMGLPIWGRVTHNATSPLSDSTLHLYDSVGVQSGAIQSDESGNFVLRAYPGVYQLVCIGRNNGRDPTLYSEWFELSDGGQRVDFEYPSLELFSVGGRVVDQENQGLSGLAIRLISTGLTEYPNGNADTVSTFVSNSFGNFDTRVVSGAYDLEVWPFERSKQSPYRLVGIPIDEDTDLGSIVLQQFGLFSGRLLDPMGEVVSDARLECTEMGWGGRSWATYSDNGGQFQLDVAQAPISCALQPPPEESELALTRIEIQGAEALYADLSFVFGSQLSGRVVDALGAPVPYTIMEIRDPDNALWGTQLTGQNGEFSVTIAYPAK